MNYLPKYFTNKAIYLYVILLLTCTLFFYKNSLPFLWVVFGIVEVVTFFYFLNVLSKKWRALSSKTYKKKLFKLALTIRLIYVIFAYFFYQLMTGQPFEFLGYDAVGYHNEANWIVELINTNRVDLYFEYISGNLSDMGYPVYLALYYLVFGSFIIIPRIANAFLGALMCIHIYKLACRNFGEAAGRISGIIALLLPNFIYYTGLHMKETLMVYIVVVFVERTDFLLRTRSIKLKNLIIPISLVVSLFFFRTVIGIIAFLSIMIAIFFSKNKFKVRRWVIGFISILVMSVMTFTSFYDEFNKIVEKSSSNQDSQMQNYATREGGNKLALYGTKSVFFAVIIVAPFPTLVHTFQDNAEMINGALFTRNIYAFFIIIALVAFLKKKKIRDHLLILSFLIGYLSVLALSGFALSERFHLPAVPFLIIIAGYGITQINKKNKRMYLLYLFSLSIVIIGWNWFKLVGRGM